MLPGQSLIQAAELALEQRRAEAREAHQKLDRLRAEIEKLGPAGAAKPASKLALAEQAAAAADAAVGHAQTQVRKTRAVFTASTNEGGRAGLVKDVLAWSAGLQAPQRGGSVPIPRSPAFTLLTAAEAGRGLKTLMETSDYPSVNFQRPGVVPLAGEPTTILDLLLPRAIAVDQATVEVVGEASYAEAAAGTAEAAAVAESTVTFDSDTVTCELIAETLPVSHQALTEPGVLAAVVALLARGIYEKLESQVVQGSGTSPQLVGLYETSGIGVVTSGSETRSAQIRKAITQVQSDTRGRWQADTFLAHPDDLELVDLECAGTGDDLLHPGRAVNYAQGLWGLRMLASTACPEGQPLVFASAALELYTRDAVQVSFSGEHSTNFTKAITQALAAGRYGFHVVAPKAVVELISFDS